MVESIFMSTKPAWYTLIVRAYITFTSVETIQLPPLITKSNPPAFKRKTERWFDSELVTECEDLHTIGTNDPVTKLCNYVIST